jgi:hypothetical protein
VASPPATGARHIDLAPPFQAEQGHAFVVSLPADLISDSEAHPSASSLVLLENGRELGPPHSMHADIRANGLGRFSHWSGNLYFSTGDNSDPNHNGRRYAVEVRESGGLGEGAYEPHPAIDVFADIERLRAETRRASRGPTE